MKAVILAGGYGTRLSEETSTIPKPMLEIGGKPILWHIMKLYSHYGINDFVILLGYKGYIIKEYFVHYFLHQSDVTINLRDNTQKIHSSASEPWRVTLMDTGDGTMTGGRLLRAQSYLHDGPFMLTYGDGVSDVNIDALLAYHRDKGGVATMTSVLPEGRFGMVDSNDAGLVNGFLEKPKGDGQWINGGFFVFEPDIFNYIEGDETFLERYPLETLAAEGKLFTYRHNGFWKCMDTLRDKINLEKLWQAGAPWKLWD